jgi:hypothetical protein
LPDAPTQAVDQKWERRVKRLLLLVRCWSPVILGVSVATLFLVVQDLFQASSFARVAELAASEKARTVSWHAHLSAARTHWATSIFVATVVMLAIAGLSLRVIWRARPHRAVWFFLIGSISVVCIYFARRPEAIGTVFLAQEMKLVAATTGFDPQPRLVAFLSGLFSTALVLTTALSLLVTPMIEGRRKLPEIVRDQREIRVLLGLTAILLVIGVIGIGLFHRMASAATAESARPAMEALGASSTVLAGAFYSALLAAAFAPVESAARQAALAHAPETQPGKAPSDPPEEWLKKQGLELSFLKALARAVAVLGPLLAGVLQNLAELK